MYKQILLAGSLFLAGTGISQAGLIYNGGAGTTVYGASQYICPGAPGPCTAGPTYIPNNLTGRNDILSSPGNGYQVANPVIANNVAESPLNIATPYGFNWTGGVSGDGSAFGTGSTLNLGPQVGFALSDTTVGCCSATYMITSWSTDYTADANGFGGPIGAYLGIMGVNLTGSDASVASLIVSYSINGGVDVNLTPMILAIGGNCVNDVTDGDAAFRINAGCTNGGIGGAFEAAALDTSAALNLAQGDTLDFTSTLTVYADPASFDSILPDQLLLDGLGLPGGLPEPILVGDLASPAPEPGTLLLLGAGIASVGLLRRRSA